AARPAHGGSVLVLVLVHDPDRWPCREGRPTCSTRNGGLAARVAPCSCTTRKRSPAAKAAPCDRPGQVALPRGLPRPRPRPRARPGYVALPRWPARRPSPVGGPCADGCPVLVHVLVHDPERQPCREGRPTCSTRNGGLAARVAPCSCTTRKRSPAAKAAP